MDSNTSIGAKKLFESLCSSIKTNTEKQEIQSIVSLLLEDVLQLDRAALITDKGIILSEKDHQYLQGCIYRLNLNEPIQYILGKTYFYDCNFEINPSVLIPRPETEELVDLIIKENTRKGLKVLDIGTGSGCIPICLKKNLQDAEVFAIDISEEALSTAQQNALSHQVKVNFIHGDILEAGLPISNLDIIVSNPPYVRENEKPLMRNNVLDYEPHLALFVKDNDPLAFYQKISQAAIGKLNPGGKLYFEINEQFSQEVSKLMQSAGFKHVKIKKDMQGKDRMVWGELPH